MTSGPRRFLSSTTQGTSILWMVLAGGPAGRRAGTARAAGLRSHTVLTTYALRNALLPVVTTLGMVFSFSFQFSPL